MERPVHRPGAQCQAEGAGGAPRTSRAQPLDMEASLKAQGIHSIEEMMQVLQGEIDKNRQ